MRALIVDDSRAMRAILRQMLKGLGLEVLEAGNGREAIERLRTTGPLGFALVDWNMPEMNGLDFVRAVRSDRAFDGMHLLMVTTETELDQVSVALSAGANEYIMKPFTREVIEEKLNILGVARPAGV